MDTFEKYLTEKNMDWATAIKYKEQTHLSCCDNCQYGNSVDEYVLCENEENVKKVSLFRPSLITNYNKLHVDRLGICDKFKLDRR
jgi:hypothetical protein